VRGRSECLGSGSLMLASRQTGKVRMHFKSSNTPSSGRSMMLVSLSFYPAAASLHPSALTPASWHRVVIAFQCPWPPDVVASEPLNFPFDAAEDAFFAWSAILPSSKTGRVRHLKRSRLGQPTHGPKSSELRPSFRVSTLRMETFD
jgi:hypothetical protein